MIAYGGINISAASQKIPCHSVQPKGSSLVPSSLTLARLPGQFIPLHSFPILYFFFSVSVNTIRASASMFEVLLPFRFPH
jgi:hypothetical protein